MKSLITCTLFTILLSIGVGLKSEAQRLFDAAPEDVRLQNKLIEDVLTMNTDSSVDIKSSQNFRITGMAKEIYILSYKVDYKGGTRYFPSSVEGEAFMRQLNKDYQKNIISNPGNVNGYYTTTLIQGLVDYSRWNTKALQIN